MAGGYSTSGPNIICIQDTHDWRTHTRKDAPNGARGAAGAVQQSPILIPYRIAHGNKREQLRVALHRIRSTAVKTNRVSTKAGAAGRAVLSSASVVPLSANEINYVVSASAEVRISTRVPRFPLKNPSRAALSAADNGAMPIEIELGLSALLSSLDSLNCFDWLRSPLPLQLLSLFVQLYLVHVQTSCTCRSFVHG